MLLTLMLACGGDPAKDTASSAAPTTSYHRDVRPILDRSCARCHTEGGQASSFDTPEAVTALAGAIKARTQAGQMPPPAPDPACADYVGSEVLFLSDADKATLATWADEGAPLGDPTDAPAPFVADTLAPFDATLLGSAPYQPSFGETGNDYRCFVLDVGNERRTYVTGFEAIVDRMAIVHHIVVWKVGDDVTFPTADDGKPGFACDGFGQSGWDFFTGWAPGGQPVMLPEGTGMKLERDARLVLQMHYFDSYPGAAEELDQSGYGLLFAESVEREIFQFPLGVEDFEVPAGATDHVEQFVAPWPDRYGPVTIVGTFPHMHLAGSGFDFQIGHPPGDDGATPDPTCVVRMEDWDFHNQQSVMFKEPIRLEGGDVLNLTCSYDNPGTEPIEWGERTDQEMCYAFTYGYAGEPLE
jgi:hypothetical protein